MDREQLEPYKNEYVAIGVTHFLDPNRLFFNYGTVIGLNDSILTLKWKRGIKEILISDIREIHLDRKGGGS